MATEAGGGATASFSELQTFTDQHPEIFSGAGGVMISMRREGSPMIGISHPAWELLAAKWKSLEGRVQVLEQEKADQVREGAQEIDRLRARVIELEMQGAGLRSINAGHVLELGRQLEVISNLQAQAQAILNRDPLLSTANTRLQEELTRTIQQLNEVRAADLEHQGQLTYYVAELSRVQRVSQAFQEEAERIRQNLETAYGDLAGVQGNYADSHRANELAQQELVETHENLQRANETISQLEERLANANGELGQLRGLRERVHTAISCSRISPEEFSPVSVRGGIRLIRGRGGRIPIQELLSRSSGSTPQTKGSSSTAELQLSDSSRSISPFDRGYPAPPPGAGGGAAALPSNSRGRGSPPSYDYFANGGRGRGASPLPPGSLSRGRGRGGGSTSPSPVNSLAGRGSRGRGM